MTETKTKQNKTLKVLISHVSDAFTELHEENVYLALIVCAVCLLRYPNVSLECVSLNVSLYVSIRL